MPLFTSAEATSDEFTDKWRYPHFFRTVSGDSKQEDFMFHFLRAMNWVYVSVVGICFEVFHMLPKLSGEKIMTEAVDRLLHDKNARVVIGFFNLGGDIFEEAPLRTNATRQFIFLGSDTVYFKFDGVFRVQPVREMNETFYSKMTDFFYQRDAKLVPEDPWIREIYANENNCSWESSEETECQAMESYQPLMEFSIPQTLEVRKYIRMYDVAYLYAKGIDKTLKKGL